MFEEARRGREWLEFLSPEPEVPAYLLDRILSETGHGLTTPGKLAVAGADGVNVMAMPPVWQQPGFAARMRRFAEPRLLMTAAMAFFSIALTLSLVGVRFDSVHVDLRPTAVRSALEKRIMTASTPIVRYYDHLRFVYEVESRMKELRRSSDAQEQNRQKAQPAGGDHPRLECRGLVAGLAVGGRVRPHVQHRELQLRMAARCRQACDIETFLHGRRHPEQRR